MKRLVLRTLMICLLGIITIGGNPYGIFTSISYQIWPILYSHGLDIAMTPFTSDMFLTHDSKSSKNFYQRKMSILIYQKNNSIINVPVEKLTFKKFKLPFLLFVERNSERGNSSLHQNALCRSLREIYPSIKSFEPNINLSKKHVLLLGFNRKYDCEKFF
jgi:hypothetical protein